jgi:hypothetical protein
LNLFDEIVPENSKVTIYLNKIEISAEKKKKDLSWPKLESLDSSTSGGNGSQIS